MRAPEAGHRKAECRFLAKQTWKEGKNFWFRSTLTKAREFKISVVAARTLFDAGSRRTRLAGCGSPSVRIN
jgi:hypothetical protein